MKHYLSTPDMIQKFVCSQWADRVATGQNNFRRVSTTKLVDTWLVRGETHICVVAAVTLVTHAQMDMYGAVLVESSVEVRVFEKQEDADDLFNRLVQMDYMEVLP